MSLLQLKGVNFSYDGKNSIIKDVNFAVEKAFLLVFATIVTKL